MNPGEVETVKLTCDWLNGEPSIKCNLPATHKSGFRVKNHWCFEHGQRIANQGPTVWIIKKPTTVKEGGGE